MSSVLRHSAHLWYASKQSTLLRHSADFCCAHLSCTDNFLTIDNEYKGLNEYRGLIVYKLNAYRALIEYAGLLF